MVRVCTDNQFLPLDPVILHLAGEILKAFILGGQVIRQFPIKIRNHSIIRIFNLTDTITDRGASQKDTPEALIDFLALLIDGRTNQEAENQFVGLEETAADVGVNRLGDHVDQIQ